MCHEKCFFNLPEVLDVGGEAKWTGDEGRCCFVRGERNGYGVWLGECIRDRDVEVDECGYWVFICNGGGGGLFERLVRFLGNTLSLMARERVLGLFVSARSFNFAVCWRVLCLMIGWTLISSFSSLSSSSILLPNKV